MSGGIAGRGRPGPEGPQGPTGPTGPQGPAAFSLTIGQVEAVPYGGTPSVVNTGTDQDQVWDISVPTGATGVLTGLAPPTGADGTSLGQLYFCSANQVYYGLVELSENENKWRPLMAADSTLRRYDFDVLAVDQYGTTNPADVGRVNLLFDDVQQQLTVHYRIGFNVAPAGAARSIVVDAEEHGAVVADLTNHGIDAVGLPVARGVNGVTTTVTIQFMSDATGGLKWSEKHLDDALPPTAGTASQPGVRAKFERGHVTYVANENSAEGSGAFGDAPGLALNSDDLFHVLATQGADETYLVTIEGSGCVVMPYE